MDLREEQTRDRDRVGALHREAFGGEHGEVVARLVDDLRHDDPTALSLVAEESGEEAGGLVGHVMFSRCRLDAPRRLVDVVSLSPLGVAPRRQRRGIGSALVRHALQELDVRGVPLVFLEGDPRYYSRLGFSPAVQQGFRKPSLRIPDAAFQVVKLSAYEPWMTGTFVYPDTFWRHDCVGLRDPDTEN
ncbi:N-acetyltransferase [Micromonospora sp. WMMC241]|uniref:GNAT family N-acetyltransferase n=1 Tax=Micromonospora sp. WMMC241 TaxID=3015159 RepID=UPI0022B6F4FA|nr:N-acetyltransferase [Micromonospora sp. WMMC241]MCZ7436187.1 N-acetyltransferase [Micromonospora sp. WMMC241]